MKGEKGAFFGLILSCELTERQSDAEGDR
jgi:hypothetical protein